jgi:cystathionine gamma-synthase
VHFETIAVRAGAEPDSATGAIAPPIHLSTTFEHGPAAERLHGYLYIRDSAGNPTQRRLEDALAAMHGASGALHFASGMAASAALFQALAPGAHSLVPNDVYYALRVLARDFLPKWGQTSDSVDMTDLAQVRAALRAETRVVWIETPSNPLLDVTDMAGVAALARERGALTVVDDTFATPALQNPFEHGADIVMHATTKALGGHSDVQGGALVFRERGPLFDAVVHARSILGGVASPFNSWLVLRGLRSLACRVERQAATALVVARALESHPAVERVHYPGLESHPGHAIACRQMKAFGGLLSFRVKGGREASLRVASKLELFLNATSLGGTESLIEHRQTAEGPASTAPENLLRVSLGLEHPDDLLADLRQALG